MRLFEAWRTWSVAARIWFGVVCLLMLALMAPMSIATVGRALPPGRLNYEVFFVEGVADIVPTTTGYVLVVRDDAGDAFRAACSPFGYEQECLTPALEGGLAEGDPVRATLLRARWPLADLVLVGLEEEGRVYLDRSDRLAHLGIGRDRLISADPRMRRRP